MNTPILTLSALALVGFGVGSETLRAMPPVSAAAHVEGYEALVEAYDQAEADWKKRLKEADFDQRREIRANPPAKLFWERFEASAQAGEGRSILWMATHLRDTGLSSSEARAQRPAYFSKLFENHASEDWFSDALEELSAEKRYFEASQITAWFERVVEKNENDDIRAEAMFRLGKYLMASKEEADQKAGKAWLERVANELGETDHGIMARGELFKPVVGELAPDFSAKTIDGYEFKLSDYRGKVVLVDFYGFW